MSPFHALLPGSEKHKNNGYRAFGEKMMGAFKRTPEGAVGVLPDWAEERW